MLTFLNRNRGEVYADLCKLGSESLQFPNGLSLLFLTWLHFLPTADCKDVEKAMATHSSTLAWKIPWTEKPGRLQFMGSLRVRHD